MNKILISSFILVFAFSLQAAELKLKKVKTLGPLRNPVIYQDNELKKTKARNIFTGKLVVKWGVSTFEVVKGTYSCEKNVCELVDYTRIATYENCIVKSNSIKCTKKFSTEESSNESRTETHSPDDVTDIIHNDSGFDFPERSESEFADIF